MFCIVMPYEFSMKLQSLGFGSWFFWLSSLVLCLNVCPPTQLCLGSESRIKLMFLYFQNSSLPRTELSAGFVGLRSLHLVKFPCLRSMYAMVIIPAPSLGLQQM